MDAVVRLIRDECGMDQFGGRVTVLADMRTCLIYDVLHFPGPLMAKLGQVATVEVLAEPTSLSGYVVRAVLLPSKTTRVLVTGTALACMCAIVAQCLRRDI